MSENLSQQSKTNDWVKDAAHKHRDEDERARRAASEHERAAHERTQTIKAQLPALWNDLVTQCQSIAGEYNTAYGGESIRVQPRSGSGYLQVTLTMRRRDRSVTIALSFTESNGYVSAQLVDHTKTGGLRHTSGPHLEVDITDGKVALHLPMRKPQESTAQTIMRSLIETASD